jgi:hypothetical protein
MSSTCPDVVFETCLPGWFFTHRQAVNRAWPIVWQQLVDELAPEPLKEGFRRGLHPVLLKLVKDYWSHSDDTT